MEAEPVMNFFDFFWFELNILNKNSSSSSKPTCSVENLESQMKESSDSEVPKLHRIRTSHTRSMSDQSMTTSFKHESLSPNSVLLAPKLQTIFSGKEVTDSEAEETPIMQQQHHEMLLPEKKKNNNSNTSSEKKKKRRGSKSLSDLEFEELKGFMDLGFVFSEEDKNSSLASILPGLQRLGKKEEEQEEAEEEEEEEEDSGESLVARPYLSEAWEFHDDRRRKENPLMNWKVPALNNETDMKDSLRLWAQTVASTVR